MAVSDDRGMCLCVQISDYTVLPDTAALSEQLRVCLQEGEENPRDFTKLFDTSLYQLDTTALPSVIKSAAVIFLLLIYLFHCVFCIFCLCFTVSPEEQGGLNCRQHFENGYTRRQICTMWQWCFLLLLSYSFWPSFLLFFLTTWNSLVWYFENCLQWSWALSGVITEGCSFFCLWITLHLLKTAFQSPLHFPIIVFWGLSAAHFYQFCVTISFVHHYSLLPRSCLNTA